MKTPLLTIFCVFCVFCGLEFRAPAQTSETDDRFKKFLERFPASDLDKDGILSRELMPDLLHPNAKGYEVWAKAMESTLSKLLNDTPVN